MRTTILLLNNKQNYNTVADLIYTDACRRYRDFGKAKFEISDFEVFKAITKTGQPQFAICYDMKKVAEALNQIKGCVATYRNYGPKNWIEPADWDEDDEVIELVLTETIG